MAFIETLRDLDMDAEEDDLSGATTVEGDDASDTITMTTNSSNKTEEEVEQDSGLPVSPPSQEAGRDEVGEMSSQSPSSYSPTMTPSSASDTKTNTTTEATSSTSSNSSNKETENSSSQSFYDYCSSVNDIKIKRQIPPLDQVTSTIDVDTAQERDDDTLDEVYYATHPVQTQLLHASVIFRHGSRAPWTTLQCWDGYDVVNNSEDQWYCPEGVSNYMTTSPKAATLAKLQEQQQQENSDSAEYGSEEGGGVGATLSSWHHTITSWFHGSDDEGKSTESIVDTSVPSEEFDSGSSSFYSSSYGRPRTTIPYFLFDKQYDGLVPPEHNYLGGTCALGQLLREGSDQHYMNGQILRDTYFHNKQNQTNMNLFTPRWDGPVPESSTSPDTSKHSIYLRSDDEQRTLLSLQILFESFLTEEGEDKDHSATITSTLPHKLPTVIPLHTADLSLDVLDDNFEICPMLDVIRLNANHSEAYLQRSTEAWKRDGIIHRLQSTLGTPTNMMFDGNFIDCLMTQFCTEGRDVPDFLKENNYELFQQAYAYFSWEYYYSFRYNNGKFSKLAMGPLWEEILDPIQKAIYYNVTSVEQMIMLGIPRLGLYSGHDETLAALLISLGSDVWDDEIWIPYASMMILEYHVLENQETHYDLFPSGRAFRLIYNGEVITNRIHNCQSESDLCDFDVLMDTLNEFIGFDEEGCKVSSEEQSILDAFQAQNASMTQIDSGQISMFTVLSLSFVTIMLTSVLTTYWTSRRYHKQQLKRNLHQQQVELSLQGDYAETGHVAEVAEQSTQHESNFTIDDGEEENDVNRHCGSSSNGMNQII